MKQTVDQSNQFADLIEKEQGRQTNRLLTIIYLPFSISNPVLRYVLGFVLTLSCRILTCGECFFFNLYSCYSVKKKSNEEIKM